MRSFQDILHEEEKHGGGSSVNPLNRGNGSSSEETKKKNKAILADYITSVPKDLGGITQNDIKANLKPFSGKAKPGSKHLGGSFSWSDFADRLKPAAYKEIVTQTFQSLNYVNSLPIPSEEEIAKKQLPLEQKKVDSPILTMLGKQKNSDF